MTKEKHPANLTKISLAMLVALIVAIFGVVTLRYLYMETGDFRAHLVFAQKLYMNSYIPEIPHALFQQLVNATHALVPFYLLRFIGGGIDEWLAVNAYPISALLVALAFYVAIGLMLFKKIPLKNPFAKSGLALALMLITPITLFTISQHRMYLGYIGISVYHNPTVILLKTISLLLFWVVLKNVEGKIGKGAWIITIALVVLDALAKPNYVMIMLPGLAVWLVILLIQKKQVNWWYIALAVALPAVLILGYQYVMAFMENTNGIEFAPLAEMLHYAPARKALLFWLAMSLAFPACVFFCYPKKFFKEQGLLLGSLILFFGLLLTYFFAETGARQYNLNLLWGAQVALLLLFVECTAFTIMQFQVYNGEEKKYVKIIRRVTLITIFALHLISGILFYIFEVIQPKSYW